MVMLNLETGLPLEKHPATHPLLNISAPRTGVGAPKRFHVLVLGYDMNRVNSAIRKIKDLGGGRLGCRDWHETHLC